MKTFLALLLALVPFVSFAQPILRNPMTTNRFMIGVPSNGQVPAWNSAAGRYSNTTISASGSAQVWTNENDYVRLIGGSTNSLKVMTNGLQGIAIGDTNLMSSYWTWPYDGLTFISLLDGTSGHNHNEFVFGAYDATDQGGALDINAYTGLDGSFAIYSSFSTGGLQSAVSEVLLNKSGGAYSVKNPSGANTVGFQTGPVSASIGETNLFRLRWGDIDRLAVHTNGNLTVKGVTYSPPSSQGAAQSVLTNDGSGNLGWGAVVAGGGGSSLWTNENGYVRLIGGSTNSLKVMTNGLQGIAIGDTNALNYLGWPPNAGSTYMSVLDGSATGHKINTWYHAVLDPVGEVEASAYSAVGNDPVSAVFNLTAYDPGAANIFASANLQNPGTHVFLNLAESIGDDQVRLWAGGEPTGGHMIYVKWHGQDRFLLNTNGNLTLGATTNHITFGATNAPPASAVAPTRWVSVLINGEATQYKIPLYQ